ncbi:TetR/AcrR family transcriptional regulator C-terminal domain-containing protein [Sporichthya brevicatena]|uniref:TetR/AcrR family transcriptional regulator C-terminal domain-containing protein n=1 Tax=Sporichthya brevicatena TaxID=171442 RepID=UPI0031DF944D
MPAVLDAALRIVDAEGVEALSMRRLADDLGIGAMTLYRYVATKDTLYDELVTLVLGDLASDPAPDAPWRAQLEEVLTGLHNELRAHPGITEIILTRRVPTPAFDRHREIVLAVLREAGFSVESAVDALTSLICYTLGFSHVERIRGGVDREEEARRLKSLPTEEFPHLIEAATSYPGHLSDRAFSTGLGAMLDGLERALDAQTGRT